MPNYCRYCKAYFALCFCAVFLFFFFFRTKCKQEEYSIAILRMAIVCCYVNFFSFFFFVSTIYFFYSCAQNCMKIIYFFHKATLKQHLSRKLYFKVYMVIDRLFKLEVLAKCWLLWQFYKEHTHLSFYWTKLYRD